MRYLPVIVGLIVFVVALAVVLATRRGRSEPRGIARPPLLTPGRAFLEAVHGESFANDDGTSRQAILARCKAGDLVDLVAEPTNRFDQHAIKVVVRGRGQIGYLPRDRDHSEDEDLLRAQVSLHAVTGGTPAKPTRGATLTILPLDNK